MPAASVRLIAATHGMPPEAALRPHTENALSARTVQGRPEIVDRLVELQRLRLPDAGPCRRRRPPEPAMPVTDGRRASVPVP